MTRRAILVIFYALVGTLTTAVVYRLILDGPFSTPEDERTLDGLILFISILLNTALAFGAAGVAAVMVHAWRPSFALAALVSVAAAGAIGFGMMLWFSGLNGAFPVTAAIAALVCALLARYFRLFSSPEFRER